MKTLDKRIFRELKSNFGKYLAIFILLTATISFGSAFLSVSDSVEKNLKENQKVCNMEDGHFILQDAYDFSNSNYEIEEDFYVEVENGYTLRVYKNRENINKLSIFEGKFPEHKNEIVIDRAFAKSNKIKLNDEIKSEKSSFKVVGIISAPDYNSLYKSNSDLIMNTKDFGIGFVNQETLTELESLYNTKYNYLYKGDTNEIKDYLVNNGVRVTQFLPKEQNNAITFLQSDMGTDVPMMRALIYIVVVIIAFVFCILASNNIEDDAKSIGTLKALGLSNKEILFHYMKLPVIVTLISAILGNILGYTALIEPFKAIYYITYSLPPLKLDLNMEAFITTTIIPTIIMCFINFFMLKKKLKFKTINFLRNDIRKSKNKNIKLSKKIPFKTRFKLRVILDNLGNFIILFLGIYLSSLILLFSVGLKPVMDNYEETVKKSAPAEYQYILSRPVDIEAENIYTLTQYQMKTYYKLGKKDISINFIGLNNTDAYFKNLKLRDLKDGIVISDVFAKKMEYKIGDEIKFTDENTNKTYSYEIADIYEYEASFAVFMKQDELNRLLELPEGYYNSALSNEKLNIDERFIVNEISRDDIGNVAKQMLNSFEEMIYLIMLFAVVIYLVLMYVLIKVIVEKNALNISLMKVMGYKGKEIRNLFLRGTAVAVMAMLVIVMPFEKVTINVVMKYAMSMVDGYLDITIPISVYIKVILIGVATYFTINGLHVRRINKVPMEEALKDRE